MYKSKHSDRCGTRAAGASQPYVADTSDQKLALGGLCRGKTCDTRGMRCLVAFTEPRNISRMRNQSAPHDPQYLF